MSVVAAILATVVLAALAVPQILVSAGRPYGRLVWGGQHRMLPAPLRVGSAVSVVIYAGFVVVLHWCAGLIGSLTPFIEVATWMLFAYFVIGVVIKLISRSRAERLVMTSTCTVLAVCTLLVAIG
ncbi:MAG TPA: hypothetical protein VIT42_04590 [Microlunatus sp.]